MADDSIKHTFKVALGVCLVCSLLVSTAAVTLNGIQNRNKRLDRIKNILIAADLYEKDTDIARTYDERIEARLVRLEDGETIPEDEFNDVLNIEDFDIKTLAGDPEYGQTIPPAEDLADIKRRPKYMVVYFVRGSDGIEKVILPVYGKGLWSTLYGFLALGKDLRTVTGITFYEHGETPGLGGEIENPRWQRIWKGKLAYDDHWNVKLEVIKGQVDPNGANAKYQIDGLSGATITTRGVDHLVKYWLGENGYRPFLRKLREVS